MISESVKKEIHSIWDNYINTDKRVLDTKGQLISEIDQRRIKAITDIKKIIADFFSGKLGIYEFKTNLDSYNKQNNLWGFTAAKGQMFFNLLTRSSESNINKFVALLHDVLKEPNSLKEALGKMKEVFDYVTSFLIKADDKRKVANPLSAAYFLSYFWQIHNHHKWPVMYSSIIVSFEKLGIWEQQDTAYKNYQNFYNLNEEIKGILRDYTGNDISNWDVEHALWNFAGTTTVNSKRSKPKDKKDSPVVNPESQEEPVLNPGFELSEYLIPRIAKLVELGSSVDKKGSAKGSEFEKLVAETFHLLDFDVEHLGQGSGREPDAIVTYPEEHISFIIDAKAYSGGYTLGTDDRAIKEYINYYCPRLKQKGFNKIGFIIVSNSFKSDLKELINDITWTTEVKRFLLLTTEALLYLVAYKTKDKIPITQIIDALISFDKVITKDMIIEEFGDY